MAVTVLCPSLGIGALPNHLTFWPLHLTHRPFLAEATPGAKVPALVGVVVVTLPDLNVARLLITVAKVEAEAGARGHRMGVRDGTSKLDASLG